MEKLKDKIEAAEKAGSFFRRNPIGFSIVFIVLCSGITYLSVKNNAEATIGFLKTAYDTCMQINNSFMRESLKKDIIIDAQQKIINNADSSIRENTQDDATYFLKHKKLKR